MGNVIWLYFGAKWPMFKVGKHYGVSEGNGTVNGTFNVRITGEVSFNMPVKA